MKDQHYYVTMGCKECGKAWTVDLSPGMVTRDTCPTCDSMKVWEIQRRNITDRDAKKWTLEKFTPLAEPPSAPQA